MARERLPIKFFLLLSMLGFLACTSKPEARIPAEEVMHFPFSMALNDKILTIASLSSDDKYDFGRLRTFPREALSSIDASNQGPVNFKGVGTNVLIPPGAGLISFENFISLASRVDSSLIALPVRSGVSDCNDPMGHAQDCPGAKTIILPEQDPYSIAVIRSDPNEEILAVSYLSAGRIDLVSITSKQIKILKSFNAHDWVSTKVNADLLKNQRFITRKIVVSHKNDLTRSKIYFLLEQHPKNSTTTARTKASYLLAIKAERLLNAGSITKSMIDDFLNLSDQFAISGVQDLFIDESETHNMAYILARVPEALYKIDLQQKAFVESTVVCTGATSMAVSVAKDMIVVPCAKDNQIAKFSMSSLSTQTTSKILGRGPAFAVIDELHHRIYCSFYLGGFVAILEADELTMLGYLFPKAPSFRTGS